MRDAQGDSAAAARPAPSFTASLGEAAEMVAFKHSVFALPFALMSLITAAGAGWPSPRVWLWTVVAMVAARTAAMSFNRLVDHRLDAANPRTAGRSLPAGRLSRSFAWALTVVAGAVFVVAAARLNDLCLALAPPTLAWLLVYSFAKRFTAAAHLWLGLGLGLAPLGAWVAETGALAWQPLVLAAAVTFWVAGFDTIYSLQDETFDRARGLRSLPARLGAARALGLARAFHLTALVGFAAFAMIAGGGWLRITAVAAAAALMAWQHRLVRPGDLRAVNAAFFTANGALSVVMLALFVLAKLAG
ncbi:MAG TPA: UbiA-like polyprenyltransferase [Candidatus Sulfomarinibacteraceae bacterium]|nr:UbiA-like polyprenyltransferase [Candidatus Sulfomarinibacteraceae bacterium]